MFRNKEKTRVHFIGIGGIGMSGIAKVLLNQGYSVSGSDLAAGEIVQQLKSLGAKTFLGHSANNVEGVSVAVYSSAVDRTNPEVQRAIELGIPLIRRAEMLAELMRTKYGLAVAGTHGKTTTTSILATILHECGFDPTYVIGGVVSNLGGHASVGKGEFLVAEADESDGSFLLLSPVMSVITNIDNDHLDFYKNSENLLKAFEEFANKIPFYGLCALNAHDPKCMMVRDHLKRPHVTFGIAGEPSFKADILAVGPQYRSDGTRFRLFVKEKFVADIDLHAPGKHNVLNALGAIALAGELEIPWGKIAVAVSKFNGVDRRLQVLFNSGDLEIIDDYAHHPTAVKMVLSQIRATHAGKIVVIFEPHRFTRTQNSWKEFLHCFTDADEAWLSPIYPASEKAIAGINSEGLVEDINRSHPGLARHLSSLDEVPAMLRENRNGKTIFVALGAGSIGRKIRQYVEELQGKKA
jgi:UDP-N-acetylmuramate--alanine ligase